jgi:CheY-like chemotaxis protein
MPQAEVSAPHTTVLVADDDVLVRIAVAGYLRECGFRVIEAAGGREAKTVLQQGPVINVLFADARLAGDDNGFALAQWARRNKPDLKVVLSAGLARKADAAASLCSHDQPPPLSAAHVRQEVEAMRSRLGRRIRNDPRNKPRAAYR